MSHEIRTPMNGIMVMAELLAAADMSERQRRHAEVIFKSSQGLLAIINDILDFSKIESGKLDIEQISLDPAGLAEHVTNLFGERAHAKGIDLAAYVAPDVPHYITGDPVRLNQVVVNLVNNALKFTESGSVLLTMAPDAGDRARLRIAVSDTGVGIPADKLADIFDAFTQADQSTTRRFGGTGLGLAICKRLVEAMGGRLSAESSVGGGSTFAFSIPFGQHVAPQEWPRVDGTTRARAVVAVAGNATSSSLSCYLSASGYSVEMPPGTLEPGMIAQADVAIVDPDRLALPLPAVANGPRILCLETFGESAAHRLVERGQAVAAIARPIMRCEIAAALAGLVTGEPLSLVAATHPGLSGDLPNFAGLRVLVADDSSVNREVAIEALERLGASVDIAENGHEALEILAKRNFDAVLMDVSMPEIDGLEATRRVRAAEATNGGRRIPIVAVTAHVVGRKADMWRDAGMDAVLYKPFTIRTLALCLDGLLWGGPAAAFAQHSGAVAIETCQEPAMDERNPVPILDADTVNQLDAMARSGLSGFVERVFGLYLDTAPETVGTFIRTFESGDHAAAGRAAHALKSMSYNIGARRVATLADDMERRAQSDGQEITNTDIAELLRTLNETYDAIAQRMKGSAAEVARAS
jgi:CheY-like chemotaxis protein